MDKPRWYPAEDALLPAFPLSGQFPAIAPHHLVRMGRARVYGRSGESDLAVTDLSGRTLFLGGMHWTDHLAACLAAHRDRLVTVFGSAGVISSAAAAFPELAGHVTPFVSLELHSPLAPGPLPGPGVRLMAAADHGQLPALGAGWMWEHLSGPEELLDRAPAYGVFVGGQLASLAVSAFQAGPYADMAVATAPAYRRTGAALACCGVLAAHLRRMGMRPVWNTAAAHTASRRLAGRLGFVDPVSYDAIWVR